MGEDAIVALATPPGRGAIALIRLSGMGCREIVRKVIPDLARRWEPRRATRGVLVAAGQKLDDCLAVYFPAPRSYTGEDCVEITLHGSPPLVAEAQRLLIQAGARPARPGEFTWRALLNGKVDLLQAEAVGDLVAADSLGDARLRFSNLEGRLSAAVAALRQQLVELGGQLETAIEFGEDVSLAADAPQREGERSLAVVEEILASARFNRGRSRGLEVGIVGRVNAGKSTLFNSLLLTERALTSPHPGTTRDVLRERLEIGGEPVYLTDAAGFSPRGGGKLDRLGIERSLERLAEAEVVLLVVDASRPPNAADRHLSALTAGKRRLVVANKDDVATEPDRRAVQAAFPADRIAWVSALNGTGIEAIRRFLEEAVRIQESEAGPYALNDRQLDGLEHLRAVLLRLDGLLRADEPRWEMAAEEIRAALQGIGRLTGTVDVEEILATVFGRFCIGK